MACRIGWPFFIFLVYLNSLPLPTNRVHKFMPNVRDFIIGGIIAHDGYRFVKETIQKRKQEAQSVQNSLQVTDDVFTAQQHFENAYLSKEIGPNTYQGLTRLCNGILQLQSDTYHSSFFNGPSWMNVNPAAVNPGFEPPSKLDFITNQVERVF
jgi:hypothetical protein